MSNYVMLAMSVPDIVEALPEGISVPLNPDGMLIMLDDKFASLCKSNMPDIYGATEYASANKIAEDGFLDAGGLSHLGPSCAFTSVIASAAGIKDPVFYKDGYGECGLPMNLKCGTREDIIMYPCQTVKFLMNGTPVKDTFMRASHDTVLRSLAQGLGAQNKLSIVSTYDDGFSMNIGCLKTALANLCDGYKKRVKNSWESFDSSGFEYWIKRIIDWYLESIGFSTTHGLFIFSTYFGTLSNCGGMVKGVPYLSIGDLAEWDEESWNDPRESDPDNVKEFETILLGNKPKIKFERFTPSFE